MHNTCHLVSLPCRVSVISAGEVVGGLSTEGDFSLLLSPMKAIVGRNTVSALQLNDWHQHFCSFLLQIMDLDFLLTIVRLCAGCSGSDLHCRMQPLVLIHFCTAWKWICCLITVNIQPGLQQTVFTVIPSADCLLSESLCCLDCKWHHFWLFSVMLFTVIDTLYRNDWKSRGSQGWQFKDCYKTGACA